jgi:hypothetical protein
MSKFSLPLELSDPISYGYLDDIQKDLIFNHDGLDLVLIENANEIFRQFIMDGNDMRIEHLLKKIGGEYDNSIYLRSDTVDIKQDENGEWITESSKYNKKVMRKYIEDATRKIKNSKVNKSTIIYTIFGVNLGEGGHYGAIVCDIKQNVVRIFDSMSGDYKDGTNILISGTQTCFIKLAHKIFNSREILRILFKKTNKKFTFTCKPVNTKYMLQPTGGFEDLISPELEEIGDEKLQRCINIQHTDSQNHFCYIWSILFIQIYLRGKMILFNSFIEDMKEKQIIPLTVIKQYILGLVNVMNQGDLEHALFFYKYFPRIWSNYKSPRELGFDVYNVNFRSARNMSTCLDYVMKLNVKIRKIGVTSTTNIKRKISEMIEDCTDYETDEEF